MTQEQAFAALEAAFPIRLIDPSHAFEAWGRTYLDVDRFMAGVSGRTWHDLSPEFLEWMHDAIVFLGPDAFADCIPAFVGAVLVHDDKLSALPRFVISALAPTSFHFADRIAPLTDVQRRAIADALHVMSTRRWLGAEARHVLEVFWSTYRNAGGAS